MIDKISDIREPVFSNEEETAINVIMTHEDHGEIPFTATREDVEEMGRMIYAAAMTGAFGDIAPYVPPVFVMPVATQAQKDSLLKRAGGEIEALRDVVEYSDDPEKVKEYAAKLEEWKKYRAAVYTATPEDAVNIPLPG